MKYLQTFLHNWPCYIGILLGMVFGGFALGGFYIQRINIMQHEYDIRVQNALFEKAETICGTSLDSFIITEGRLEVVCSNRSK